MLNERKQGCSTWKLVLLQEDEHKAGEFSGPREEHTTTFVIVIVRRHNIPLSQNTKDLSQGFYC